MLCFQRHWPQISFVLEVQTDSYMQSFEVVHSSNDVYKQGEKMWKTNVSPIPGKNKTN